MNSFKYFSLREYWNPIFIFMKTIRLNHKKIICDFECSVVDKITFLLVRGGCELEEFPTREIEDNRLLAKVCTIRILVKFAGC